MSDKTKHTPGPWTAHPQPGQTQRHYYTHMVLDPTGNTIASLLTVADARLIAAAPELLAACREALLALTDGGEEWATTTALRAAIAKTKG